MVKSQLILRCTLRGIPTIAVVTLFSAYSANNAIKSMHLETRAVSSETPSLQTSQGESENLVRNVDVESRVAGQYADWRGVRYRLGGSTKKGVGCFSFVQRTLREQLDLELPRSTYEQREMGESVSRSSLRTSDLVLFCAGSTGYHADIYIGNNQFVHASISSGVTISSINEPYWKRRYNEAYRVLSRS